MARLRATASAARSVLDSREHDGMLRRVGGPIHTNAKPTIKKRERKTIKKRAHA
jgi:phosphoserine phosphatase